MTTKNSCRSLKYTFIITSDLRGFFQFFLSLLNRLVIDGGKLVFKCVVWHWGDLKGHLVCTHDPSLTTPSESRHVRFTNHPYTSFYYSLIRSRRYFRKRKRWRVTLYVFQSTPFSQFTQILRLHHVSLQIV